MLANNKTDRDNLITDNDAVEAYSVTKDNRAEKNNNAKIERCLRKIARERKKLSQNYDRAMSELYDLTKISVYGFILSILKNPDDAEDVMQDTYIKICMNADLYSPQGKPMAWIFTIARNLSLMKLRSQNRFTDIPDFEWNQMAAEHTDSHIEDQELLAAAFTNLSEEERQIVMMHAVSGIKHREIADYLDLPLATVLSKYNRAIKKLKKILEEGAQ